MKFDKSISVSHILVISPPGADPFQVAGDEEGINRIVDLLASVPKETKGDGWILTLDTDAVYCNSDGEEIRRIPGFNSPRVPDCRTYRDPQ